MKISSLSLSSLKKTSKLGDHCLVIVSEARLRSKTWAQGLGNQLQGHLEKALKHRKDPLKAGDKFFIGGLEKTEPDIWLCVLPEHQLPFDLLGFAGASVKNLTPGSESLSLIFVEAKGEAALSDIFGAALAVRIFKMPVYGKRTEKVKDYKLSKITIFSSKKVERNFQYGFATGETANIVRFLSTLPPNILNTHTYATHIKDYAKEYKLQMKFHSKAELKKMGAGAFLAVDRGDPNSNGGIYELTYLPSKPKNKSWVSLVGKGICFDTGGYDVKTQSSMGGMKGDMAGSAMALAGLIMARKLNWPIKMKAFLAVTENHISPEAYKADEVVIALNGLSIEIINTDAEGRMILADALALASRAKPQMIVDFATLTGAAHVAIGTTYSAGFTNRDELQNKILKAGRDSGERVWPFPIDRDFGKFLESPIADFAQCYRQRCPDHIVAAYFLSQFVDKEVSWVHVDLSAADRVGGLAHVDSLHTGFGARWLGEFMKLQFKI